MCAGVNCGLVALLHFVPDVNGTLAHVCSNHISLRAAAKPHLGMERPSVALKVVKL